MTSKNNQRLIRRRALFLSQNADHPLYQFCLTGRELGTIAQISRVGRDNADELIGYQRPEVKKHVQDIVEYLNGKDVIFPNAIILALNADVRFIASRGPNVSDGFAQAGTLEIPIPKNGSDAPAWIVDGQQRVLALSKSKKADLPVPVTAFLARNVGVQRDQFIRINNARPLPKGLLSELLPAVDGPLPMRLAAKKAPSIICDELNRTASSPFFGLIKRHSTLKDPRGAKAVITDTSIMKMVEDSMGTTSGILFPYRNVATGETDVAGMVAILSLFWTGVRDVFPQAWGKDPAHSRLMHGAGIRAMGKLMDRVMGAIDPRLPIAANQVVEELLLIAPFCRWTSGAWEEMEAMKWNDIQNTPKHIRMLSNHLIRLYLGARSNLR
jgi:DGQHR domain-containing protein